MGDVNNPVTLSEIAGATDVSVSTVSRVMAGRRGISRETAKKVRKVATELGYKPKPSAPVGRKGKVGLRIGLVHVGNAGYQPRQAIGNHLHQQFIVETWQAARNAGHMLCIDYLDQDRPGDRSPLFAPGAVDGVIVKGNYNRAVLDRLPPQMPAVLLRMSTGLDTGHTCVDCNYTGGIARCVQYLYELGHRRIAFFSLEMTRFDDLDKILSYQRTLAMLGLDNVSYLLTAPTGRYADSDEACGHAVDTWSSHPQPPTAIISSEAFCHYISEHLHARGKRVPRDVSLIDAVTGASPYESLREHATRLRMPAKTMCQVAVGHLIRHIQHPDAPPQTVLMEMDFIEGDTTAPPMEDNFALKN